MQSPIQSTLSPVDLSIPTAHRTHPMATASPIPPFGLFNFGDFSQPNDMFLSYTAAAMALAKHCHGGGRGGERQRGAVRKAADSTEEPRLRRNRTAFNDDQLDELERCFQRCQYPDVTIRDRLSRETSLPESKIQVWFKNRRAKHRKHLRNLPAPDALDCRRDHSAVGPLDVVPPPMLSWPSPLFHNPYLTLNVGTSEGMLIGEKSLPSVSSKSLKCRPFVWTSKWAAEESGLQPHERCQMPPTSTTVRADSPSLWVHTADPFDIYIRSNELPNCSYRYDLEHDDVISEVSLVLDGPLTLVAALIALIGMHLALKFLSRAGLNRDLTASLYLLCFCDAFLMVNIMITQSIEATGVLVVNQNPMWNRQSLVLLTHWFASIATTASTLLVVNITFQRFLVVWWPLKYARLRDRDARRSRAPATAIQADSNSQCRRLSTQMDVDTASICRRNQFSTKRIKRKTVPSCRKMVRPFVLPACIVLVAFMVNCSTFFEFVLTPCVDPVHHVRADQLSLTRLRESQTYRGVRTVILMVTQTIGPILTISFLTVITEYKVHASLKARRLLFESQKRRRSLIQMEEIKERLSRFVAIFIAIKFIIFRSLPVLFDTYETVYGIDSFGTVLSILVRLSDFGIVLNSATNSFAYFGKTGWLESKLRGRLLRRKSQSSPSNCGSVVHTPLVKHESLATVLSPYRDVKGGMRRASESGRVP